MSDQNIEQTQPSTPAPVPDSPQAESTPPGKKTSTWKWVLGGILFVLLIAVAGGAGGYSAGISERLAREESQKELAASMQYQLGVADLEAGRYDLAKQRFEYVIQIDPSFPGVLESMAKLTIITNATATPVVLPTATPAPTADLSGVEALLAQAKQQMVASDWNGTLETLDELRKQNSAYHVFEVDGLYYRALRNRGLQKISNGNLEGGIYDFALVRNFGPEDKDAADMEQWASLYISAGRYFGWDWANSVKYFGELYQYIPTLMDSSHRTVADRYRQSLGEYASVLAGKEKWCDAQSYYEQSLAIGDDKDFASGYAKAYNKCQESLATEVPIDTTAPEPAETNPAGDTSPQPTSTPVTPEPEAATTSGT